MSADDSSPSKSASVTAERMLACFASSKNGASLSPTEIAQELADADWHGALAAVRRTAIALAREGRLVIYRKGKPVDPDDFRGVYRIGLPRHD